MQIPAFDSLFIGQHLTYVDEIDSTNNYLKNRIQNENLPEGFVVLAGNQTAGKGQNGKLWSSGKDVNLLASILLKPTFLSSDQLHYLVYAVALGVIAAIQRLLPNQNVQIKWPNDILVNSAKISGILIENVSQAPVLQSVVGIGVNVNQSEFESFPLPATSISLASNHSHIQVSEVCKLVCDWVEKYYLTLRSPNGMQQIHQLYVSQLYKLNDAVYLENDPTPYYVRGVNPSGKILLESSTGILELTHNEIGIHWN